jgi:hypothetical protein
VVSTQPAPYRFGTVESTRRRDNRDGAVLAGLKTNLTIRRGLEDLFPLSLNCLQRSTGGLLTGKELLELRHEVGHQLG